MLNSVSAGTLYNIPNPLQAPLDLQRVNTEILTQNFERVHERSAPPIDGQVGAPAVKSAGAEERGSIFKLRPFVSLEPPVSNTTTPTQAAARVELFLYRMDRPPTVPLLPQSISPAQAAAKYAANTPNLRDFAVAAPSINLFA
ncbi:MAG: hypothetical protein HQL80_02775 [Magnetococcales bacterium]|nr:hypothetical protein [Magnetococcales bacterium]